MSQWLTRLHPHSGPTFLCLALLGATITNFVLRFLEQDHSRVRRGLQN